MKSFRMLRRNIRTLFIVIAIAIAFTGCIGTSSSPSPEMEIQRTLDDFLILESQHIYFLTTDWTFVDIERVANRTYAEVVIVNGEPVSIEELIGVHRETWQVWEQLDEKERDDLRSMLEENHFIIEIRQQEILVSKSKDSATAQGILYGGLLLPSGDPVDEEMLIPINIELRRLDEVWRITELTTS